MPLLPLIDYAISLISHYGHWILRHWWPFHAILLIRYAIAATLMIRRAVAPGRQMALPPSFCHLLLYFRWCHFRRWFLMPLFQIIAPWFSTIAIYAEFRLSLSLFSPPPPLSLSMIRHFRFIIISLISLRCHSLLADIEPFADTLSLSAATPLRFRHCAIMMITASLRHCQFLVTPLIYYYCHYFRHCFH